MAKKEFDKTGQSFHFEKALNELNSLVEKMEQGDLPLEESLALFEKGVVLTRDCQLALKNAQQKVNVLMEKQGKLVIQDFTLDDNHG